MASRPWNIVHGIDYDQRKVDHGLQSMVLTAEYGQRKVDHGL